MLQRGRVILTVILGLAVTSTACADMMPVSQLDTAGRQAPNPRLQSYVQPGDCHYPFGTELAPLFLNFQSKIINRKSSIENFDPLPAAKTNVGQTYQVQSLQILTDGQGSLSLCLYALIGLGLCKCAPFAKRLSFGPIPQWYHDGGPYQIGHSFAIPTESLCSAPALCFIQPDCTVKDFLPQRYREAIYSLLRKSIFTPILLTSRGPPLRS